MLDTFKTKKYLTTPEAIKVIIGEFSPEQLKKLEVIGSNGRKVGFEKHLFLMYQHKYCKYKTIEEVKDAFSLISIKKKCNFLEDAFDDIFQEENPEQVAFVKEKQWKKQQIHMWISSGGIVLSIIVSIIVPIILKYV